MKVTASLTFLDVMNQANTEFKIRLWESKYKMLAVYDILDEKGRQPICFEIKCIARYVL